MLWSSDITDAEITRDTIWKLQRDFELYILLRKQRIYGKIKQALSGHRVLSLWPARCSHTQLSDLSNFSCFKHISLIMWIMWYAILSSQIRKWKSRVLEANIWSHRQQTLELVLLVLTLSLQFFFFNTQLYDREDDMCVYI